MILSLEQRLSALGSSPVVTAITDTRLTLDSAAELAKAQLKYRS